MADTKNLDLELGALYRPEQVKHLFGKSAEVVRRMCEDGEIEHIKTTGRNGHPSYLISENAIRAWRRKHTRPAV